MAIIHCGFVSHQSLVYLTRLISTAENPSGFIHNEIIAQPISVTQKIKSKID
jgi:hypothetical protein